MGGPGCWTEIGGAVLPSARELDAPLDGAVTDATDGRWMEGGAIPGLRLVCAIRAGRVFAAAGRCPEPAPNRVVGGGVGRGEPLPPAGLV
jgi:hypothetical protein